MAPFLPEAQVSHESPSPPHPVKTAAEAEQLKQRIAKGEAFDVLAKKFSTCPSGKRGGDLGEVRPGQLVGAIDR